MYPAAGLQKGIYEALTAAGVRAYDRVPTDYVMPYATIDDAQILDDGNTCDDDVFEVFATIHYWSRTVGQVEAKLGADTIRGALKAPFLVDGFEITSAKFESALHLTEPDGLTAHAVITFRYLLQTA